MFQKYRNDFSSRCILLASRTQSMLCLNGPKVVAVMSRFFARTRCWRAWGRTSMGTISAVVECGSVKDACALASADHPAAFGNDARRARVRASNSRRRAMWCGPRLYRYRNAAGRPPPIFESWPPRVSANISERRGSVRRYLQVPALQAISFTVIALGKRPRAKNLSAMLCCSAITASSIGLMP